MSVQTQPESYPKPIHKIRHCRSCEHKCDVEAPIVGCESVMAPGYLEWNGNVYTGFCVKRIWFDKNYRPVEIWKEPTEEEFKKLLMEAIRYE